MDVVVQRCIVHLIRNSLKYVPTKDYKRFTQSLKSIYGASSLTAARKAFDRFCQEWSQYPGAVGVWKRNFSHVEQLFDYGSAVRKIMYTTNAIESINSSFRKVTKKGAFTSENALLKVLYLRIQELYRKWNGSKVQNWATAFSVPLRSTPKAGKSSIFQFLKKTYTLYLTKPMTIVC